MLSLVLSLAACGAQVPQGQIEVLQTLPHDSTAYTQGLVLRDGVLYESTGQYDSSDIRRVDPNTGEVLTLDSLGSEYFGEGLALVGERLIQLTWKEHVAFVYDLETLAVTDTLEVSTFGWGLCYDGETLFQTSGGSVLFERDAQSFDDLGQRQIVKGGAPVQQVNELECVGEHIYANVYQSDVILKIDKRSGEVVAEFDASSLVPAHLRSSSEAVLNGIAYDPGEDRFYVTGKLWPVAYWVRLSVE
jgi:glutamine cyclotransferase